MNEIKEWSCLLQGSMISSPSLALASFSKLPQKAKAMAVHTRMWQTFSPSLTHNKRHTGQKEVLRQRETHGTQNKEKRGLNVSMKLERAAFIFSFLVFWF